MPVVLTLLLLAAEPTVEGPKPFEARASADLTIGRGVGASLFADLTFHEWLTIVAGYQFLKPPPLETDGLEALVPATSHVVQLGGEVLLGERWMLSLLGGWAPRVGDRVVLNPNFPERSQASLSTTREGGTLNASALVILEPTERFSLSLDGGLQGALYRLSSRVAFMARQDSRDDTVLSLRPTLGAVLTIDGHTDVGVRGAFTAYSMDPLTAGRFTGEDFERLEAALRERAPRLARLLALASLGPQRVLGRAMQFDAVSGFTQAPVWLDTKVHVLHRFGERVRGQLAWTWLRSVPTQGSSNIVSAKVTVVLPGGLRLWLSGAVQLDQPTDDPAQAPLEVGGLGTLGAELELL